jgi:hypothetical protein
MRVLLINPKFPLLLLEIDPGWRKGRLKKTIFPSGTTPTAALIGIKVLMVFAYLKTVSL